MAQENIDAIAAENVSIRGSVHNSGEAYLSISRLHTPTGEEVIPVDVSGSVHGISNDSVTVGSVVETLPEDIPEPADDPIGFTDFVDDREEVTSRTVYIERLYVSNTEDPALVKSLGQHFKYVDELNIRGSVHGPGKVSVDVEDLYVVE